MSKLLLKFSMLLCSLIVAFTAKGACELYSLDLSDAATYSTTCGTISGTNWKVSNGSTCTLTTSVINLPGDSAVDVKLDIPSSIKIHPSGNCDADDYATFEYSVNGGTWTNLWTRDAASISGASTFLDTVKNISAGSTLQYRITYAAVTNCTNWKLFSGDLCVSWPLSTGTGMDFSSVLPVELSSFTGVQVNNSNRVDWSTDTETDNDYFTLQRSENGLDFENIAMVDGAGNSTTRKSYTKYDEFPLMENNYYKLIQTDFDQQFSESEIIAVYYTNDADNNDECEVTVYPNPCVGKCNVDFKQCNDDEITVAVYDAAGHTVYQRLPMQSEGASFVLDSKNNLMPGMYIVVGKSGDKSINKKIIVQ